MLLCWHNRAIQVRGSNGAPRARLGDGYGGDGAMVYKTLFELDWL